VDRLSAIRDSKAPNQSGAENWPDKIFMQCAKVGAFAVWRRS
jgi:hypothetical protein